MISEINLSAELKKSRKFAYALEVPFFQANTKVEFKPGINVLYGPNGCGKSTLLKMIALTLAAEQGGVSTITDSWLGFDTRDAFHGFEVVHDGQPLLYGNPRDTVGLIGGGFDDDFMDAGLHNTTTKASTGQTTVGRLDRIFSLLMDKGEFPSKFDNRVGARGTAAIARMKGSIPHGRPTLVLDEPESGLAVTAQSNIFRLFQKAREEGKYQLIVATHSPFALGLHDVNFIDMQPGYREAAENAFQMLALTLEMRDALAKIDREREEGDAAKKASTPKAPAQAVPDAAPAKKRAAAKKSKSA